VILMPLSFMSALLAPSFWLLALGYWLLAIGYWLLATQVNCGLRRQLLPAKCQVLIAVFLV